MNTIIAIRPGVGHVEFDGHWYWVVELGFTAEHSCSSSTTYRENAVRWLREM